MNRATSQPDLRRSIVSLGAVSAFDMASQVVLPMVLVRLLSDSDFGQYRAVWLLAGTALALLPLAVPASLFYFLPRHTGSERAAYLRQSAWFMLLAGLVGGITTWLIGDRLLDNLTEPGKLAGFVGLWVFGSVLDVLFNAQQRSGRQAGLNLAFSVLRIVLIVGAAWVGHSISLVLSAHLVLAGIKAAVCAGCLPIWPARPPAAALSVKRMREQLAYAVPFGVSSGLYLLRGRIDQWLVAGMFPAAQFGLYSVAAVFIPVQGLVRTTVNGVLLPEMNRLNANADSSRMLALSRRSNLAVSLVMFPVLAYLACATEPVLDALFTRDYTQAAPVVRVYCAMLLVESIEVTMLLTAFRQGRFMMYLDTGLLCVSVAAAWLGARHWGLAGAAAGGLAGAVIGGTAAYLRCARQIGQPVAALQDWPRLARVAGAALSAAALAMTALHLTGPAGAWAQVAISGVAFVLAYWLCLRLFGLGPLVRDVFGARLAALAAF